MPSSHYPQTLTSEKLLRNRYQTEYLQKFCNDSKSVLYGYRQVPEHVWLETRPIGQASYKVVELQRPTYLRPPFASRLGYYKTEDSSSRVSLPCETDKMDYRRNNGEENAAKALRSERRCKTSWSKQGTGHVTYTARRPVSEHGQGTGLEAINKITLKKYQERSYENMIGPRVFFRPTIPARRYDYVIHPAFHSETKKGRAETLRHAPRIEVSKDAHKKEWWSAVVVSGGGRQIRNTTTSHQPY